MNISCQSIIDPKRPGQGIADLERAGFDSIMLDVWVHFPKECQKPTGRDFGAADADIREARLKRKYAPETIKERYAGIVEKCRKGGIRIAAVRAPRISCAVKAGEELDAYLERSAEESICLCGRAGCKYVIIEPLFTEHGKEWEVNRRFYMCLAHKAQGHGVCILLKNQCRDIGGHFVRGNCAEARMAAEWVDKLNEEAGSNVFGFCADCGVCSLCGNDIQAFLADLGSRIKAVILRDCDGHDDEAMLPFTAGGSGTDWMGVIRGLRDIGFSGELLFDFSGTVAAFSPLLKPALYGLAREVAQYFRWQIQLEQNLKCYSRIVLFGAGNMCRNYMKNYGDKYPPLFACDNDRNLWGTEFCGLEVKDPEALRKLPADCGIFICNIYYREIEAQLREMGIKGKIEYFNDEYMPSFYFDRLDREE